MKRSLLFLFIILSSTILFVGPLFAVNGFVEEVEGQTVLHVWGTHYEMGYAYGFLMGEGIMEMVEDYTIDYYIKPFWYRMLRETAEEYLEVPSPYNVEMEAMVDGMKDAGVDIFIESLGRDADAMDIAILNSAPESNRQIACSSHSGWGKATRNDPFLGVSTVICRDLDWLPDSGDVLYRNMLIATFSSTISGEQPWVSIGFTGIIGCLSGFNSDGVGVFLDMGNQMDNMDRANGVAYVPELISLRFGIENSDYNGDGSCNIIDIYKAVEEHSMAGSYCIHAVSPWTTSTLPTPAVVIEAHYSAGVAPRFSTDDEELTPFLLIVTNHHRVLFPPEPCYRYEIIRNRLKEDYELGAREAWDIKSDVVNSTLQTMLFRPDSRDIRISFAVRGTQAPFIKPVFHTWESLFPDFR